MKKIQTWAGFVLFVLIVAIGIGVFAWKTSRPVELKAEDLVPAETCKSYPGTELLLEISKHKIVLAFRNDSDTSFEFGAAVGRDREHLADVGIEILLDGVWYEVPFEEYATAGVGIVLGPGEAFLAKPILEPYGTLPDGQYRLSFRYWYYDPLFVGPLSEQPLYMSYARFDVSGGGYVQPKIP